MFILQCHYCPVLCVRLRIVIFTLVSSTMFIVMFLVDNMQKQGWLKRLLVELDDNLRLI